MSDLFLIRANYSQKTSYLLKKIHIFGMFLTVFHCFSSFLCPRANHSRLLFCKEGLSKERRKEFALGHKRGKSVKNCQKLITNMIFWSKSVFFESNLLSKLPMLLFFKEQQERLAHGCSIAKSNKSDSSQLLFFKE